MKIMQSGVASLVVLISMIATLTSPDARAFQGRRLELSAQESTPLATVLADLEKRFGWVITYEDPVYEHSSDLDEVTSLSRPDDSSRRRILSPRQGMFAVDIDVPSAGTAPADALDCVRRVIHEYNQSGNPGRFRVVQADGMLHVLPRASNGTDGQLVPRRSILETRISIPRGRRSAAALLKDIVTAVESRTGVEIAVMSAPANLFAGAQVEPAVVEDLALNMLARELRQLDARLSWRLMYSPTDRRYMLTIYKVLQDEGK